MKKLLALLLSAVMLLSFVACGTEESSSAVSTEPSAQETTAANTATTETAEENAPAAESAVEPADSAIEAVEGEETPLTSILADMDPVELPVSEDEPLYEIWMAAPGTVSQVEDLANDNETYAELQKRTGVKITFLMANFFAQMDQFNLMAASGDFPAVMNGAATLYSAGPDAALEEDIFINLLDYAEYMPHYEALINSREGLFDDVATPEGNLVGFYSLYDYDKYGLGDKGYLIRQDWLDDLGMDMPKTYDELHDVLTAFKDEKGADSAFVLPVSGTNDFVLGGFGVGATFYVEDDTIKFGPMEEGFKEYLQLMNQWYSEGLMYNDFYNYANEIMFDGTDMIGSGQVALYYNETGTMTAYAEYANDPNFLVGAIAPVGKSEEEPIYMTEFTPTYVDNCRWSITTNCEDPEIMIQVADYLYTEEGILLANYGVEGVTFEYNAEGKPQFTDLIMNNPDGYAYRDAVALHVIDGAGTVYDALRGASGYTDLQLSSWDDWTDANLDYSRALPSKEMLNVDEKSEYASIYSDIQTFLEEAIIKYIIGDFSFDNYETEFIGQQESMNIQRCIELYQQAYDWYMETHS